MCVLSQGNSVMEIFRSITDKELELPSHIPISAELRDLLYKIFEKDPTKRPTTRVSQAPTHPAMLCSADLQDACVQLLSSKGHCLLAVCHELNIVHVAGSPVPACCHLLASLDKPLQPVHACSQTVIIFILCCLALVWCRT